MVKIAPSILSSDFGRLAEQVIEAEEAGADWIHVDVMDGSFVPNITIGPAVTEAVRSATDLPIDVHLMINNPDQHLEAFADAGADYLTVHQEACVHLHKTIDAIRDMNVRPGITLNPATSIGTIEDIIDYVLDPFCVQDEVEDLVKRSGTALEVYFAAGIEVAMNEFNGS